MKPSDGSGAIPAFARPQRSSQVNGQPAEDHVAKESDVHDDGKCDHDLIHR